MSEEEEFHRDRLEELLEALILLLSSPITVQVVSELGVPTTIILNPGIPQNN